MEDEASLAEVGEQAMGIAVGGLGLENVKGVYQDGVSYGCGGFGSAARGDAVELVPERPRGGVAGGDGAHRQRGLGMRLALGAARTAGHPGPDVLARASACPGAD